jgi:protein transport protein SEC23
MVGEDLVDAIRTLRDVKEETASYLKAAQGFYDGLAQQASHSSHSVDFFCCSIDQIGLYEMRRLSNRTGGMMVLTDKYISEVFSSSLQKGFNTDETGGLVMGFGLQTTLWTSPGLAICGAISPGFSLLQKVQNVSEVEIGNGMSNTWRLGSLDGQTTIGYYLDVTTVEPAQNKGNAFAQLQVKYQHSS